VNIHDNAETALRWSGRYFSSFVCSGHLRTQQ